MNAIEPVKGPPEPPKRSLAHQTLPKVPELPNIKQKSRTVQANLKAGLPVPKAGPGPPKGPPDLGTSVKLKKSRLKNCRHPCPKLQKSGSKV